VRTALLFLPGAPSAGASAPGFPDRLVADLRAQLGALGYGDLRCVDATAPLATIESAIDDAVAAGRELLMVDARLVAHTSALRALTGDSRTADGVLVAAAVAEPGHRAMRVDRGVVVDLSSPLHEPLTANGIGVGVCRVSADLATNLPIRLVELRTQMGDDATAEGLSEDPVATLTAALVGAGARLSAVDVRGLVAHRADNGQDALQAIERRESADEDRAWLDAAVKARDGWFTTFLVSPYTRFWARWAAHRGFTPNQVTAASMAVGLIAAVCFAAGARWAVVLGAIALQLSFSLDCVDGQLSRYTQKFSAFGGWLDSTFDRLKETLVYTGLAVWGARIGDPFVWVLAAATLSFQTIRHTIDFAFAAHRPPPTPIAPRPRMAPGSTSVAVNDGPQGRVLSAAGAAEDHPLLRWGKRMVVFPIGERFAVISLTAAFATPRVTFLVLLAWGAVAFGYTLAGRVLRARAWGEGRWRWLAEPGSRTLGYGAILLAGLLVEDAGPAAYAALAVLVTRHYDEVYRTKALGPAALQRRLPPWWIAVAVVAAASVTGTVVLVLWIVAAVVGVATLGDAVVAWVRAGVTAGHRPGDIDDEEGM
jgi:hypothetical protein